MDTQNDDSRFVYETINLLGHDVLLYRCARLDEWSAWGAEHGELRAHGSSRMEAIYRLAHAMIPANLFAVGLEQFADSDAVRSS